MSSTSSGTANNQIIITGASGFVGQNLQKHLNDRPWKALSRNHSARDLSYADFWQQNDLSFCHYIHLAGKAHDLKKTSGEQDYWEANYELTRKLYDRFLQDTEAKSFIFISSVKACADRVAGWLTEETPCAPETVYGKSKRKAEEYLLDNLPEGKRVYILRPCMIHGPGNKGNLNLLYAFAKKGLPYPLAAFKNERSFLSVDNLCWVMLQLMEKDIPSGIYQVADSGVFSTNELIKMMAASLDKPARLLKIPSGLIRTAASAGDLLHLPLNSERLQKLTESYRVSNDKLLKALGSDLPLSAEEGFEKTFRAFKG
ncbi:NAD-dependent epimerase/dehydratase family protein [Cyclobacterium sp.]|uniref:NAD-dependent epimerase/dehydratase family protein n=1 Tax=Cyclobacterium sp. TaxID=1966343 RepID=UPI0019A454CA|nr:NAD-dependent epimerase/dehydratase family protein [Cyclobacterium sp.]MBD3630365.1 NAD-dependent epimerase/dehydratase family protein [Cyclobacterium sp.]